MKKNRLTSIILVAFILTSCGTPQTGNTYITPQQINEPSISEITPIFETQIERINNCDGTNPTYNVSYKTIETQKATFEVSVGAGGLVSGTPIPPVLEVQLEAKITAALAKDYGLTTEKNHELTLNNVQGTFLEHTITWKVTRVKGFIEVIYGDGIAQVGFEKIANVELYNRTSQPIGCDGSVDILPANPATLSPTSPQQTPPTSWSLGILIFEENFENGTVTNLKTVNGFFDIVQMADRNHAWQTTASGGSEITLPTTSNDYAVEVKIMQVSGQKGFGSIEIRKKENEKPCRIGYATYLDIYGDWLNLVEYGFTGSTCDEIRQTGLFANYKTSMSNGIWYTVRMEAKGAEIRVYLDGKLVAHDKDIDGTIPESNIIGISACCGDSEPFVFNFDDIKVWLVNP